MAAELRAREQAERDADLRARQEAQQRAEASAAQRTLEQEKAAARGISVSAARKRTSWARYAFIGVVLVVGCGVAALQVLPLSGLRTRAEMLLSDRLQEQVNIASFRFMLLPSPQIRVDRITIGRAQEITIETATVPVAWSSLLEEHREFEEAQLTNVKIEPAVLPRLASFGAPRSGDTQINFRLIRFNGVKTTVGGIELPPFDGTVTLAANGAFQKAQIQHAKLSLEILPLKDAGGIRVNFTGKGLEPSLGPGLEYAFLSGTAVVDQQKAAFSNVEARVANGNLTTTFTLSWGDKFRAQGDLSYKGGDIGVLLPAFTREFQSSGTLDLEGKFSSQGATLDELFSAPTMNSTLTATRGSLNNLDLVRAIQSPSRSAQRGGRTPYNEITGEAQAAGGRIALRNLKLSSGPMNGTGAVDVAPGGELSGRLNLVLGSQAVTIAKGSLNVSGSLKDPQLSQ